MSNCVRLLRDWAGQVENTLYQGADQDWLVAQGIADYNIIEARFTGQEVYLGYLTAFYGLESDDPQNFNLVLDDTYPVGTMITIVQYGAGAVTIVAPSGVDLNGSATETADPYDTIAILKDGENSWLAGNFVFTSPIADLATEAYVDGRLSAAQRTAIDALVAATATAEDIVNALQAT